MFDCEFLQNREMNEAAGVDSPSGVNSPYEDMPSPMGRSPNPNNPMEYCSTLPPHQQVTSSAAAPISVMVPVGVLKREGVPPKSQRKEKNVMFSDGIRPGCDLTDLDNSWDSRPNSRNGKFLVDFFNLLDLYIFSARNLHNANWRHEFK